MLSEKPSLLIVEQSEVIGEGINALFYGNGNAYNVVVTNDFDNLSALLARHSPHVVIINPLQIQNRVKPYKAIKWKYEAVIWIALIYNHFEKEMLDLFDEVFSIGMPGSALLGLVERHRTEPSSQGMLIPEKLSERETDVLVLLAQGKSNKIIADQLAISVHTVISHRKSISNKTGIRSQAGLTIFAISNKIVSLETLSK